MRCWREREEGTLIGLKTSRNSWASWVFSKTRVTIHQRRVHMIGNVWGSRQQDWLENGWQGITSNTESSSRHNHEQEGQERKKAYVQQGNRWVRSWYRACHTFDVKCRCFTIVNKMPVLKTCTNTFLCIVPFRSPWYRTRRTLLLN